MVERFELPNIINNIDAITRNMNLKAPGPLISDTRTRAERREDFEKKLKLIDKKAVESLRDKVKKSRQPDDLLVLKEDIEDFLSKFIDFYDRFDDLNSEESRKVALKEKELKLDARYDWAEKARLFLFRILGSALVVVTLFAIGYIEHEYEWARLPMSKYISTSATLP